MNPLMIKGLVYLVIFGIVFGAGFQVATWKWSGKVEKEVAARETAEKEAREKSAFEAQWRKDVKDVNEKLTDLKTQWVEAQRLYDEATSAPPEIVIRYRDRWRTVTETITSEDCVTGVGELFTFIQELPERPQ